MPKSTLEFIRQALLLILFIGVAGTESELLLLKHTDGFWQLVPVTLNALILASIGWFAISGNALSIRAMQYVLALALASGALGVFHHMRANIRDASESNPSLTGRDLYVAAAQGTTPALAPGAMVQLALIGLAFTYRHPLLRRAGDEEETINGEKKR